MVTRTFFNTGQALFSMETYGDLENPQCVVVYDCGGKNAEEAQKAIKRAVKHDNRNNKKIDALFISHYDGGHINGIKDLLNTYDVEHLFLPCKENAVELILSVMYQQKKIDDSVLKFYESPKEFLQTLNKSKVRITYINPPQEGNNTETRQDINLSDCNNSIQSGTSIKIPPYNDSCWRLIPFNRYVMTDNEWDNFVHQLNINGNSVADVLRSWKNGRIRLTSRTSKTTLSAERKQSIKDTFLTTLRNKRSFDINEFSMVLYSGPARECGPECEDSHCCHSCHLCHHICYLKPDNEIKYGCLYTGDYNANRNVNELIQNYRQVWNNIGIVQIPHHGSSNNFSDKLVFPNFYHVIPYGDQGRAPKVKKVDEITLRIAKSGGFVIMSGRKKCFQL